MAKSLLLIDSLCNAREEGDQAYIEGLISEFEQERFDVTATGFAAHALRLLEENQQEEKPFDVILLAAQLPIGNEWKRPEDVWEKNGWPGLDVLERIRAGDFGRPDQPVVIVVRLDSKAKRKRIQELNPIDALNNPRSAATITEACKKACKDSTQT